MLVEIPDPEIIFSVIIAFLVGLFGLYFYIKIKPLVKFGTKKIDSSYLNRLEYYEQQLIDMKIRLDSINMVEKDGKSEKISDELHQIAKQLTKKGNEKGFEKDSNPQPGNQERLPNLGYDNIANHVLRLITDKPMTSRDIQITIGRTREHTSRLMKKLFEDGYVKRDVKNKPFSYSITEKGQQKLGVVKTSNTI